MGFTAADLSAAADRVAASVAGAADELNAQDGLLGDGDLGITVSNGWREAAGVELPDDLGKAFLEGAKAFQRVSSSSFGTLTATALMAAAKSTRGRTEAEWSDVSELLAAARDAMMARGKGELGQKSVLDMMDALARATHGLDSPETLRSARRQGRDRQSRPFPRPNIRSRSGPHVR